VIMTSGLICFLLLRKKRNDRGDKKALKAGTDAQI
jgi:hypothetical protein